MQLEALLSTNLPFLAMWANTGLVWGKCTEAPLTLKVKVGAPDQLVGSFRRTRAHVGTDREGDVDTCVCQKGRSGGRIAVDIGGGGELENCGWHF